MAPNTKYNYKTDSKQVLKENWNRTLKRELNIRMWNRPVRTEKEVPNKKEEL
jgi:hypothetical protein